MKGTLCAREFRSLVDLGTASVKALVVELRRGQTHIWGHGWAPFEGGYGPDGTIVDHEAVAVACDAALTAAEEMTLHTLGHKIVPDQSVWSVPGWFCQEQAFTFQERRSRPTKHITQREWLSLQARLERVLGDLSGVLLEVLQTTQVNGSTVTEAVGLHGETLALQTLAVTADAAALTTLQEIADALELDPPHFVSQARASTEALPSDSVLLDLGRWGTNVAVISLGQLAGATWIPLGGQSFYRTLANTFELEPSQLDTFCEAYIAGWLPPKTQVAASAALAEPVNRWLDLVADGLSALADQVLLPHRILLAGGGSLLPAVLPGAHRHAWMRHLRWPRHPEVCLWQATIGGCLVDQTDGIWRSADLVRLGLAQLALKTL